MSSLLHIRTRCMQDLLRGHSEIMKRVSLIVFLLLFLTACGSLNYESKDIMPKVRKMKLNAESQLNIAEAEYIRINISEISSCGCSINYINTSDEEISFGSRYIIECFSEEKWYSCSEIELNTGETRTWTDILCVIEPHEEGIQTVNWEYLYGVLPAGRYRLIKEINLANGMSVLVGQEFIIED